MVQQGSLLDSGVARGINPAAGVPVHWLKISIFFFGMRERRILAHLFSLLTCPVSPHTRYKVAL